MDYDVAIIGAGIVGAACAMKLSGKGLSCIVLERHEGIARETSSRNSEVIHAGMYYPTGSLKALLCTRGNYSIYEWCQTHRVPHQKLGKYIIALTENDIPRLIELYEQGKLNGVENFHEVSLDELKSAEPNVKACAALFSENTGIVDSHSLIESFCETAKGFGCDFAFNHEVISIGHNSNGYSLGVKSIDGDEFTLETKFVINAAGLDSDSIAAIAGIDIQELRYELRWTKGSYFRLAGSSSHLTNHLIYPIVPRDYPGIGIHVTLDLGGGVKLGPDAVYMNERVQDYRVAPESRAAFYDFASKYLPDLEVEHLIPDQSGIRPRLKAEPGEFRDFIINEESQLGLPGFINLIGIESPGLTCSLEIAEYILQYLG